MIKVIIFDGDGTLQFPNPSEEIRNLVSLLPGLGIKMAVASNGNRSQVVKNFSQAGMPVPEIIVTPKDVGTKPTGEPIRKPSPQYVYVIRDLAGVELNEIVYVGDDDTTDTFCAINAGVLPLTAKYSTSDRPKDYGLSVSSPSKLEDYIKIFAKQNAPYFGWVYQDNSHKVDIRALFGDQGGLKHTLKTVLKEQQDLKIGSNNVSVTMILFLYFMTQFYMSGVAAQVGIVTVYPGHTKNSNNQVLSAYLSRISKMFRKDRFFQDLLIRHQDAPKSQFQGAARNIFDQFRTIHVNPKYRDTIQDKTVLVLDDFTTAGYSLETARQMLLQAGASKVIGLAIAKFRLSHSVAQITQPWNPFEPCMLRQEDIKVLEISGSLNSLADQYFHEKIWKFYQA